MKILNDQERELLGKINIYDAILLTYKYICALIRINEQHKNRTLDSLILIAINRLLYFCDEPMTNILLSQGPIFLSYVDRLPAQKTLTGGSRFEMKTILSFISLCTSLYLIASFAMSLLDIHIYLTGSISLFPNYDGICIVDSLVFLGDKRRIEGGVSTVNPSYYTREMGVIYKSIEGSPLTETPMYDSIDLNNIETDIKYFVSTTEQALGRSLHKNESIVIDAEWNKDPYGGGFNIIIQGNNVMFIDNFTNKKLNTIVSLGELNRTLSVYDAYKKFLSVTQSYSTSFIESIIKHVSVKLKRDRIYVIENRDFLEKSELYYEVDSDMKRQVKKLFNEFQSMSYDEFWKDAMKEFTKSPDIETFTDKFLKMNEELGIVDRITVFLLLAFLIYVSNIAMTREQINLLLEPKGSVYNMRPFEGEKPPVENFAIGIFAHGEILVDDDGNGIENRNFPEDVTIHKQNFGAYGCISVAIHSPFKTLCYQTMHALSYLSSCVNVESFLALVKYHNDREKKIKPLTSSENTCQIFTDKKRYYEKRYEVDDNMKYIILSYYDVETNYCKFINIVDCSPDELLTFFKIDNGEMARDEFMYTFIQFCISRKYGITTTNLFRFIEIARIRLDIKHANILDQSCNVMRATPRHGSNVCEGLLCPEHVYHQIKI